MVSNHSKVLGVLDGHDMPLEDLLKWTEAADVVLAADGAANALLKNHAKVDAIIGDLDALDRSLVPERLKLHYDPDQDTFSDCDKLLAYAKDQGFKTITIAGVEGDRLDHVLASLSSFLKSPLSVRLALRQGVGWIIKPGSVEVCCGKGHVVSLIPLMPCEGLSIDGVQWPLKKERLSMLERVSISNVSTADTIRISLAEGAVLLTINCSNPDIFLQNKSQKS